MNWHTKNDWTGYSFDTRLYPFPDELFKSLEDDGLLVSLNLHDADGVNSWEEEFPALCAALGLNDSATAAVPFDMSDLPSQLGLEDVVLQPLERLGVDFWWIDWQQGERGYGASGLKMNPTIWTSHMRSTSRQRRGSTRRSMVLSRWGGLGGHRYQVGFSGDVKDLNWHTLAYQAYFSATAANVAYTWSHDICGPQQDQELYTRWFQFGTVSSVMRMHDRGMSAGSCADDPAGPSCVLVMPWLAETAAFQAMRAALLARARLVPVLYTALREAWDSGLGAVRPMYLEYPEEQIAYLQGLGLPQFFFGGFDLLVSPVMRPADPETGLALVSLWVPPGTWVERATGLVRTGKSSGAAAAGATAAESVGVGVHAPQCPAASRAGISVDCAVSWPFDKEACLERGCCWDPEAAGRALGDTLAAPPCFLGHEAAALVAQKEADLGEVPTLVKAGAIVPELDLDPGGGRAELVGAAGKPYERLVLSCFVSGVSGGVGRFYEDDGTSTAYAATSLELGAFTWTNVKWTYDPDLGTFTVVVGAVEGGAFEGRPDARAYRVKLVNAPPPASLHLTKGGSQAHSPERVPWRRQAKRRPPFGAAEGEPSWHYDGAEATLTICLPPLPTSEPVTLVVAALFPDQAVQVQRAAAQVTAALKAREASVWAKNSSTRKLRAAAAKPAARPPLERAAAERSVGAAKQAADALLSGVRGAFRRAALAKLVLNEARLCPGEVTGQQSSGALQTLAATPARLSRAAALDPAAAGDVAGDGSAAFWELVAGLPGMVMAARREVADINATSESAWRVKHATALLRVAYDDLLLT
mmetsp:Transcript_9635/g.21979  ORF Transcript_9635/g.21979 Transcript_9635/m.21979 type:complete len:813 (-) Transcript_9635:259-2697(-)